jgi:3-deoxy-D-manno-octulosonic acid (KDO) 8-phosphate synthase
MTHVIKIHSHHYESSSDDDDRTSYHSKKEDVPSIGKENGIDVVDRIQKELSTPIVPRRHLSNHKLDD